MEGEGKRRHSRSCKGKKANLDPGPIQEYDFFVTQDGNENQESGPAEQHGKSGKKSSRNKPTDGFFLE
jgi:hypothetical protein